MFKFKLYRCGKINRSDGKSEHKHEQLLSNTNCLLSLILDMSSYYLMKKSENLNKFFPNKTEPRQQDMRTDPQTIIINE